MIRVKVEWATSELECDKLRHEIKSYREREQKLEEEKYEESLKLSILEKQTEINNKIKEAKKMKPQMQKLKRMFSITKDSRKGKKVADCGT